MPAVLQREGANAKANPNKAKRVGVKTHTFTLRGLDPAPYDAALSAFLDTGAPLRLAIPDAVNPRSD